jgi:hypothetical protein
MGFWFLVVGFVNPLTLSVGPCYGPWALDCLTMGFATLVVGLVYFDLGFLMLCLLLINVTCLNLQFKHVTYCYNLT